MAQPGAEPEDPEVATDGGRLVVRELGEETLVYDRRSHQAHCLSPALARVFEACGANRTRAEIARALQARGLELEEPLLSSALEWLRDAGLLTADAAAPGADAEAPRSEPARGRRALLREAAAAAGLALVSMAAPTAAEAASCTEPGVCVSTPDGSCTGLPCCGDPTRSCQRQGGGRNCTCR